MKAGRTMLGQRIAHFEIREELGTGSMGVVYRAVDTVLERDVALKLIRPELTETPRARNRFLQECRTAASVNHPGIATIYEAGQADDGQLYFASELVAGEPLAERLTRGPLTHDETIDIGIHLGRALAAAHAHGIVHRDLKPANLMILPDGQVKILDFGLARLVARDDDSLTDSSDAVTQTRIGVVVGTPAYMAPEQAAGGNVDDRADIFAFGSVLYAALSGRDAFRTESIPETLRRILVEEPPPLESIDPGIPPALGAVVRRAMAKEPGERFASADDLADALESVRSGEVHPLPAATSSSGLHWTRVLGAAVILALVGFAVWQWAAPDLAFESRDRLFVADVDNLTEDSAFDLALRTALEADLQQSRRAVVFDRGQAGETLRLMRRDPATRIDEATARDICRFAGVRALILPRILAVGDAYELQAILIEPASGKRIDRVRVTARGREQVLLEGIDELARQVRTRIGESVESIREADKPVARVVTSSWEALNYFAMGNEKWREANYNDAVSMYELALEKDPEFVSAKGSMALLLIQFLNQPERGRQLLSEAHAASADLPERERLMLDAVAVQFVEQNLDKALEAYRVMAGLYPDMLQPYNNSGRILTVQGRYEEAIEMYEKAHTADPGSSVPLSNLYFVSLNYLRDAVSAEDAARRMVALGPTTANFRSLLGWSLIAQGRFEEAIQELRRVLDDEPRHRYALPNAAHTLYVLGRTAEALPLYRRQHDSVVEAGGLRTLVVRDLAMALDDFGEGEEARERIEVELERLVAEGPAASSSDRLMQAQLYAIGGDHDEARRLVDESLAAGIESAPARINLAQAYALLGENELALAELQRALQEGYGDPYFPLVMPMFRSLHDDRRFLQLFGVEPG